MEDIKQKIVEIITHTHKTPSEQADEILLLFSVIGSYAIVRWYDNNNEDVVCTTKEVAEDYVKKYNTLSGKEKCFVDTEIWLPLREA
jgi:hypothetical protein